MLTSLGNVFLYIWFEFFRKESGYKMSFDGAIITEQKVTFGIFVVKPSVLCSSHKESIRREFSIRFGNIPIILMAQNSRGVPTYDGRRDIVQFLSHIHPSRIPWKRFNVA